MIVKIWDWIYNLFYVEDEEKQKKCNDAINKVKEIESLALSENNWHNEERIYKLSEDLIVFIEDIRDGDSNG